MGHKNEGNGTIIERKEIEQVLGHSARRAQKREQHVRESTKYGTTVPLPRYPRK